MQNFVPRLNSTAALSGVAMAGRRDVSEPRAEARCAGRGASAAREFSVWSHKRLENPNSVDEDCVRANHHHHQHNR